MWLPFLADIISRTLIFGQQNTNALLKNILKYLHQPYPVSSNRWKILIMISIFVGVFILVFQPFGLQRFQAENKTLLLLGYGLVTFAILFINLIVLPWIFPSYFGESHWNVLKQIVYLLWIVFSIGIGNYFYSIFTGIIHWSGMYGLLLIMGFTLLIAVFPIVVNTIISQNQMQKRNQSSAHSINHSISTFENKSSEDLIRITASNNSDHFELSAADLLYIESEGNYVNIHYNTENKTSSSMLRNTLKNVEDQLIKHPEFFKCHRAFIVNTNKIKKVDGNSTGLRIKLHGTENEVPVARNYTKNFREIFLK